MKKEFVPYVVGIPNLSVGLLWAMNMSLIPMLVATVTDGNLKLGTLTSMGAFTGIFVQYLAGIISDRSNFKMGKRKPFILCGAILAAIFVALLPLSGSYSIMFGVAFLFYFSLNFFQGPYYTLIPEVVEEKQLGLPAGILSDKTNRKLVLLIGTIIFTIGLSMAIFVQTADFMYILLGLIGIGFICIQVTIYAILAEIVPPERLGEFMGIMNLFISASQCIATLSMGWILDLVGFKYFFPVSAVIMLIAVFVVFSSKFDKFKNQSYS